MAEYQLTHTDVVFKYEGAWWIPNDPANTMRMEYDKWLADGGVPDPAPPQPEPPPPEVQPETQAIYAHENRIRALEGQPPLTLDEFVTHLINKTLDKVDEEVEDEVEDDEPAPTPKTPKKKRRR